MTIIVIGRIRVKFILQELQLSTYAGKTRETGFKIYNAGNLELNLSFWFMSHSDLFTVNPETMLALQPAEEAMLGIKFTPHDMTEERFTR